MKEIENKKYVKMRNWMLDKLAEIYIFSIIIIFPLCVDSTGFFKILECKYRTFLFIGVTYIALNLIMIIYFYIFYKVKTFENIRLSKIQFAVLGFWGVNILATIFSPYNGKYNLLVGIGRGEGLINISLYCLTFLFVTMFGKFRKRYILYFSISSICLNTIAILQYVGFNPFNMYQDGIGTHNVSFMTTLGNIDIISAVYCILLTISFSAFVFLEEKILNKVIHLISIFIGFFIFIIINVMSGRVAFLTIFALLMPFIITNSKRLYRTIIAIAMIILGLAVNIIMNPEYHYSIEKLTLDWQFNKDALCLLIIVGIFMLLAYILYKNEYAIEKKIIIKRMYIAMIIGILLMTLGLYFINFNSGTLYEVHELLHGNFDDQFGTYRIFLWKRAFKLLNKNWLIGSGPDTFAVRFMDQYTDDVKNIGELSINDTAGNVYITMLINIGGVGLLSYLIFMFIQLKEGIKRKNSCSIILLIAIVCFWIQDFFNLWVVIVTPIFWALMALHQLAISQENNNEVIEERGITNERKKEK